MCYQTWLTQRCSQLGLDCKNGYWQVKLDKGSSILNTLNTPFGRYEWTIMCFGISSAGEIFQRCLDQAIEGLDGVRTVVDDLLIIQPQCQEGCPIHPTRIDSSLLFAIRQTGNRFVNPIPSNRHKSFPLLLIRHAGSRFARDLVNIVN